MKNLRIQKRYQIGKFLRLNLSKSGVGFSLGVTGLRYGRGPSGSYFSIGLPGSGVYYRKKIGNKKGFQYSSLKKLKPGGKKSTAEPAIDAQNSPPETPQTEIEKPGFYASRWEKEMYKGVMAYYEQDYPTATEALREAREQKNVDPAALVLLAVLLSESVEAQDRAEAIALLEEAITTEQDYPTPAFDKYLPGVEVNIPVTANVEISLPIQDAMAATLLLVELYQEEDDLEEAIDLLEEVDEIVAQSNEQAHNEILRLSLFELYFFNKQYQEIINKIQPAETVTDDAVLGQLFFYARALQESNLHTGAIQVFNKCLRRKKGLDPQLRSACRLWRALSYLKTNDKTRARKELERVLAEAPSPEIRKATMQALRAFWPEEFSAGQIGQQAQLTS